MTENQYGCDEEECYILVITWKGCGIGVKYDASIDGVLQLAVVEELGIGVGASRPKVDPHELMLCVDKGHQNY